MEGGVLREEYRKKKGEIFQRLKEFRGSDVFYELCFCLLTPQSKARRADEAIQELKRLDFRNQDFDPVSILKGKIRFHNNKAKNLIEMKSKYEIIENKLKIKDPVLIREWLIENIRGVSYKEAGHFLRNIGFSGLAILDRHILKNLVNLGVIEEIPKTLNKKQYLEIEGRFKEYSREIKIPMDHLDLLFWSIETGEIFR